MNRKEFLSKLTLTAFALSFGNFSRLESIGQKKRVVIIGAGFAGLSAAKYLQDSGFEVIVLESRKEFGGRIRTFTDWGFPMDLGASWIHGPIGNPLTAIAKKLNIPLIETPYDDVHFWQNGERANFFQKIIAKYKYESIINNVGKEALSSSPSVSIQNIYSKFIQYETSSSRKNFIDWYASNEIENEMAADMDQMSAKAYFENEIILNGIDSLPATGYKPIIASLAKDLNIIYNSPVKRISYNKEVSIETINEKYKADFCIIAVPLGVLKSGNIIFEPALKEKQVAINSLEMGTLNKVYTQWDEPWWERDALFIGIHEKKRMFPVTLSYGVHDKNTLLTFFQGKRGKELESQDNEDILKLMIKNMEKAFGKKLPLPKRFLVTKWNKDVNTMGSFSYFPTKSNGKEMDVLASIEKNIAFAGEHTVSNEYGYAHGAYNSGIAAAQQIIKVAQRKI